MKINFIFEIYEVLINWVNCENKVVVVLVSELIIIVFNKEEINELKKKSSKIC